LSKIGSKRSFQTKVEPKNGPLSWRLGPGKLGHKGKTCPKCDVTHRKPQTHNAKNSSSSGNVFFATRLVIASAQGQVPFSSYHGLLGRFQVISGL